MFHLTPRKLIALAIAAAILLLTAGCDSSGRDKLGVDGYWKGRMIEVSLNQAGSGQTDERPRRILLQLDEEAGVVSGQFAHSSDVIAFKQAGEDNSRQLSLHDVDGTLDGTQLRLRFSAESGRLFELEGEVDHGVIRGTYRATDGSKESSPPRTGKFSVERF